MEKMICIYYNDTVCKCEKAKIREMVSEMEGKDEQL